jgi:hypothetical protein
MSGTEFKIQSRCLLSNLQGNLREKEKLEDRRRWEDNIKMDLQEVGWEDMDWIDLVKDTDRWRKLVNVVMDLRVP